MTQKFDRHAQNKAATGRLPNASGPQLPEGYFYANPTEIGTSELAELYLQTGLVEGVITSMIDSIVLTDKNFQDAGKVRLHTGVRTAEAGQLIGYGSVLYQGKSGELCDFGVVPDHRHRGIGRAIIDARLASAEAAGITSLYMPYLEPTNPLTSYYLENGFRQTEAGEFVLGANPVSLSGIQLGSCDAVCGKDACAGAKVVGRIGPWMPTPKFYLSEKMER